MEEDELLALKSIYCLPGELKIVHGDKKDTQVTVQLHRDGVDVKVVLDITPSYPNTPPDVSILSAAIDRRSSKTLRDTANQHAMDNTGSPMLIELISLLQDKLSMLSLHPTDDACGSMRRQEPGRVTLMLHLDHMRAKSQYVKTIRRWTAELGLDGRLVFWNRLILILLQGSPSSLKEYMVRHKSVNIDVDSRGHPCKEKMMSVLCETSLPANARFEDFSVVECESLKEVKTLFDEHRMEGLYVNYVQTIKGFT
ncbi:RWD domain-containing protein 3-like [Haliotis rufescens]|uniref:RWD domain-containing protein 3-like n=1 Tax=Haliotis rufescens TaxID=6454 RepID=UPI00201FA5C4|nr:RWD domain-containing protein 3-like [Haliotis rufescens]